MFLIEELCCLTGKASTALTQSWGTQTTHSWTRLILVHSHAPITAAPRSFPDVERGNLDPSGPDLLQGGSMEYLMAEQTKIYPMSGEQEWQSGLKWEPAAPSAAVRRLADVVPWQPNIRSSWSSGTGMETRVLILMA